MKYLFFVTELIGFTMFLLVGLHTGFDSAESWLGLVIMGLLAAKNLFAIISSVKEAESDIEATPEKSLAETTMQESPRQEPARQEPTQQEPVQQEPVQQEPEQQEPEQQEPDDRLIEQTQYKDGVYNSTWHIKRSAKDYLYDLDRQGLIYYISITPMDDYGYMRSGLDLSSFLKEYDRVINNDDYIVAVSLRNRDEVISIFDDHTINFESNDKDLTPDTLASKWNSTRGL